jgi:hypothetical protein
MGRSGVLFVSQVKTCNDGFSQFMAMQDLTTAQQTRITFPRLEYQPS